MEDNYSLLEPHHFDRKPPREFKNRHIWLILAAAAALLLLAVLQSRPGREEVSHEGEEPASVQTGSRVGGQREEMPQPPEQTALLSEQQPRRPRIAIIIDDVGYNFEAARLFIEMDVPLSFAVLPLTPYSERIARLAWERGHEVILHLPMEPYDYPETDPGPGTLLADMTPQELVRTLERDLSSVPRAVGVSNHMGSRLTGDERAMEPIMRYLKEHGLFFVDSLTAPDTVAYDVAKGMGLKVARRRMFLDNVKDVRAITENVILLAERAEQVDGLVGIAHPHPATYEALKQALPRLREDGVRLVPISALVR